MSGGAYSYAYGKVLDFVDEMRPEGDCNAASSELREEFREHLRLVAEAMRSIEWNDSGDGAFFEVENILKCLGRKPLE